MENQPTLSPAAQAVLDTFLNGSITAPDLRVAFNEDRYGLAAALRAVADLVAPEGYQSFTGHIEWDQGLEARNDSIREHLLAIANELEAHA